MELNLTTSTVLEKNLASSTRITANQGSSRSTKTYSLMQLATILMVREPCVITIARKTLPALKASAYRDFLEIIKNAGIYDPSNHTKSPTPEYRYKNALIEFISVDNFEKVKGRKRDYLFMNEANEMSYQDYTQLAMRTTRQIYMDFNPSHSEEHWIEQKIKTRDDVTLIHSTYKDNPFLEREIVFEIERLRDTDPNLWRIYGLGELGIAEARIYHHFNLIDELPERYNRRAYGIDFGFNHPTVVTEVREYDDEYYADETFYEKGFTNSDLIAELDRLGIDKMDTLFCDYAEPDRILELQRAGYNAVKANKDVEKGIDTVKSKKLHLTKRSVNALKEYKMYSYKTTPDGKVLDQPVKENDDFMDALRYAVHSMQDSDGVIMA